MNKISYNDLIKILKRSESILGLFPQKAPNFTESGYELTLIEKTPLKSKGKKVGEHTYYHVIRFPRGGYQDLPTHLGHWSYGDADSLRVLFTEEIKQAKKRGQSPQLDVGPTHYTSANVQVQATIAGTQTTKTVYTMSFRNADMYLTTFGPLESAQEYGRREWSPTNPDQSKDLWPDSTTIHYEFTTEAIQAKAA